MRDLWEKLPYWVKVLLFAVVLVLIVRVARADSTPLTIRQLNSLVRDGAVPDSPAYGLMLAGYDGTNTQLINVDATGQLQVDVLTGGGSSAVDLATFTQATDFVTVLAGYFDDTVGTDPTENDQAAVRIDSKRALVGRIEGETRGVSADVLTAGADDTVNTTNSLVTSNLLYGYESVGAVWDRLRMDTTGSLFVSLATALDSSIDSVSIAVNDVIPQMDSTDRLAVSIYGWNAAAGDMQPTVTTAGAADLANTLDTLNVTSFLVGWDGTDWDRLSIFSFADDVTLGDGTDDGLLGTMTLVMGYDEDDTNSDRIYSYDTDGDGVATEGEGVTLATTGFNRLLNPSATFDRQKISHTTGFTSFPSAACGIVTVTGAAAACTTSGFTAVGSFYQIQSNARAICRAEEDATTPSVAVTTDMPVESPGVYYWTPVDTNTDTLCCDTSSGDAEIRVCLVTFP